MLQVGAVPRGQHGPPDPAAGDGGAARLQADQHRTAAPVIVHTFLFSVLIVNNNCM